MLLDHLGFPVKLRLLFCFVSGLANFLAVIINSFITMSCVHSICNMKSCLPFVIYLVYDCRVGRSKFACLIKITRLRDKCPGFGRNAVGYQYSSTRTQ